MNLSAKSTSRRETFGFSKSFLCLNSPQNVSKRNFFEMRAQFWKFLENFIPKKNILALTPGNFRQKLIYYFEIYRCYVCHFIYDQNYEPDFINGTKQLSTENCLKLCAFEKQFVKKNT